MPLTYRDRGVSGTQIEVLCGELPIATVWRNKISVTAGGAEVWRWTFALTTAPFGFQHHGSAHNLEEAKFGVERNWQAWLTAAGLAQAE